MDNASAYYLFDSDNKIVRVGKAILSGAEVVKYVADDEFIKRYSLIFELGDVLEWTHLHQFYAWMDSIIASRLKLCSLYSPTMQLFEHEFQPCWFLFHVKHIHQYMTVSIPAEFHPLIFAPSEMVVMINSGNRVYTIQIENHKLTKGWYKLALDHKLGKNYTMLFAYVGYHVFDLFVFDEEGSRIEYKWTSTKPIKHVNGRRATVSIKASWVTSYLPSAFRAFNCDNQFCKILRRPDLKEMELPDIFKKIATAKGLKVIRLLTNRRVWKVEYSGGYFRGEGWSSFVAAHKLVSADVLLFSITRNMRFHTLIFNKKKVVCVCIHGIEYLY